MRRWKDIIKDLREPLDVDRVKTRQQGGTTLPYLKGDDVINTANRIFEEDGWGVVPLGRVERFEVGTKQTDSGQTIIVFVYTVPFMLRFHGLLEDGTIHTVEKGDIGKNSTQSEFFSQHEMAISGCATDALKRAMRHLGRQFGITLYDKESEDFLAVVKGKKTTTTKKKKSTTKKKKTAAKAKKDTTSKKSKIQTALEYVIPEQVMVEGKKVRLPNAGKTVEEVLDDPMGETLLTYLAGLRDSPAGTSPFVAQTAEETSLQKAISYVLLNKQRDSLEEKEIDILKARLKG